MLKTLLDLANRAGTKVDIEATGRHFDLNIEKILEGWEVRHAIREIIANALDEQVLTGTQDVEISAASNGDWHIRDWGRGLRYESLTQNESQGS